ncbi:MAG: YXWGXW repeat-containing protein [Phycisphaerae bacterium]
MNRYRSAGLVIVLGMLFWGTSGPFVSTAQAQEGVEAQTRGPVHEAFAELVSSNPEPGIIVSKAPPQDIEEIPPEQKPEGESIVWVPGYWAFDDDQSDFMWISGIWRVPPPGYTWVPGYWTRVEAGYQWIAGFWSPVDTQTIDYLPPPPENLDQGPSGPQLSPDSIWIPGSWYWTQGRYAWRPGYWLIARQDWVWVPAHYVWTPSGYVFVDGHWDYPIRQRGILFAPVYIQRSAYVRKSFFFSPSVVIDIGALTAHLFARPRYEHYYFGDYYATTYAKRGIHPWFEIAAKRHRYDPIFAYAQWQHRRDDPHWGERLRVEYKSRQDNPALRPARTFTSMRTLQPKIERLPERDRRNLLIARSFKDLTAGKNLPMRFERLPQEHRQKFVTQEKEFSKFSNQRSKWELQGGKTNKGGNVFSRQNVKIPAYVFTKKPGDIKNRMIAPPPKPLMPKFDTNIKPRVSQGFRTDTTIKPRTDSNIKPKSRRQEDQPSKDKHDARPRR